MNSRHNDRGTNNLPELCINYLATFCKPYILNMLYLFSYYYYFEFHIYLFIVKLLYRAKIRRQVAL